MNFKTNRDQLVIQSVIGKISDPPLNLRVPYRISAGGKLETYPGTGGICYNVRIGDSAIDLWADHVEPAVSILHPDGDRNSTYNGGLQVLSCVGNKAMVVSGEAKGVWGRVTGKHGGIYHVMIDFTREQMEKMAIGDKIQVMSHGQGFALTDYSGVLMKSLDPDLFDVMGITPGPIPGSLTIRVTHIIPAAIMGSGLGHADTAGGDYDIQMFDKETVKKNDLNSLRFGDIVAITDADHSFGRIYKKDSVSVGVIVHSRSVVAGHGPGVTTLFTSTDGLINLEIDPKANLRDYFQKMEILNS